MTKKKDWFVSWFDTSYYHILYKHRDDTEAQEFMRNLTTFLEFKKGDKLLDLACGRGRHAIFLNSLGFDVVGADLSKNNIEFASKFKNNTLHFLEHDMRIPFKDKYDAVLNLFTSFGFFENDEDDIKVLFNIKNALNNKGVAIIDFMNTNNVIQNLIAEEVQIIDGITFEIKRYVKDGFIVKEINFYADGKEHVYFEKVKNLNLTKIKSYLNSVDFKIKHIFGNYSLETFDELTSERLILVLE